MGKLIEPKGWTPKYKAPIRNWYQSKFCKGVEMLICHEMESVPFIQKAIEEHDPVIIIETGTAAAGLTLALHEAKKTARLYTIDNLPPWMPLKKIAKYVAVKAREHETSIPEYQRRAIWKAFDRRYVTFIIANIFANPKLVQSLALLPERKLVYCDNGNKIGEVNMLAPLLYYGDMLGVHDWRSEDSIDYGKEGIAEALEKFDDHPYNEVFIKERLRTRLFIKVR